MALNAKGAATGAATGALAGAALGPWGAAAGGLIGGAVGLFSGGSSGPVPTPQVSDDAWKDYAQQMNPMTSGYTAGVGGMQNGLNTYNQGMQNNLTGIQQTAGMQAAGGATAAGAMQNHYAGQSVAGTTVADAANAQQTGAAALQSTGLNSMLGFAGQNANGVAPVNSTLTNMQNFYNQNPAGGAVSGLGNLAPNIGGALSNEATKGGGQDVLNTMAHGGFMGNAQQAAGALGGFAQQPEGPSAAEAMLKQQSDDTMAQNLSLARSGRGAGASAANLRNASFNNADQQQQLGQSMAGLRANEYAQYRGQNLQALQAASQAQNQITGMQQSAAGTYENAAINAMQGAGNLGLGAATNFAGASQANQNGQTNLLGQMMGGQLTQGQQTTDQFSAYLNQLGNQRSQDMGMYTAGNQAGESFGNLGLGYGNLGQTYTQNGTANQLNASGQMQGANLGNTMAGYTMATGAYDAANAQQQYIDNMVFNTQNANAGHGTTGAITGAQLGQQQDAANNALLGSILAGAAGMAKGSGGGSTGGGTVNNINGSGPVDLGY